MPKGVAGTALGVHMSERDQMAAAMLQVIFNTCSNWTGCQEDQDDWYWDDMESAAEVAYRLADAMMMASYSTKQETKCTAAVRTK